MVRQQTWQESQNSDPSPLDCRCGNRFSDFQAWRLCQASYAVHQAATICSGGRYGFPLNKTAQTMRAILLANATVATCLRLHVTRLVSHVLRPTDCLVLCSSTVCAPCTKSFRRYLFPCLLIPVSFCLPPVECSPGTTPSQAANPRVRADRLAVCRRDSCGGRVVNCEA